MNYNIDIGGKSRWSRSRVGGKCYQAPVHFHGKHCRLLRIKNWTLLNITAVNLLFYVRACPHSGNYSGTSLGVRSVALLHSQATLAPLLLLNIHAPLYIVKKVAKSITSFATFFIFFAFCSPKYLTNHFVLSVIQIFLHKL